MDSSRYTQKIDTTQIQQDLRTAVTDGEILLQSFEMEVLGKLRQQVETVVSSEAQQSEQRLNQTLGQNCTKEYRQLQENLRSEADYLTYSITRRQQRLERLLLIVIIVFSVLLAAIIITLAWLLLKR